MNITERDLQDALGFLVDLEPTPEVCDSMAEYDALMAPHASAIAAAKATIRGYGEQLAQRGLAYMQGAHKRVMSGKVARCSMLARSIVSANVNHAWDGLGGWQK